jgi:hypothetical protein
MVSRAHYLIYKKPAAHRILKYFDLSNSHSVKLGGQPVAVRLLWFLEGRAATLNTHTATWEEKNVFRLCKQRCDCITTGASMHRRIWLLGVLWTWLNQFLRCPHLDYVWVSATILIVPREIFIYMVHASTALSHFSIWYSSKDVFVQELLTS